MTPADKRILELVDRWLTSLDLHLKYAQLDDAAYWQVQAWPKHDRPSRWILELARQKVLELKTQCESRAAMGDGKFAESLELMNFLANLVGSQHVQRFVPLADPAKENPIAGEATVEHPVVKTAPARSDNDSTREMPRPKVAAKRSVAHTPPAKTSNHPARAQATAGQASANNKPPAHAKAPPPASSQAQETVVADAVRLLKWGRQWHELAELIARMAERPAIGEVRRILRARKHEIESLSAG